jgi:peroxiredoxin Q/BCP
MARLRQEHQKFVSKEAELIAVGPEDARAFTDYWHKNSMNFIGIPDHEHVIADLYDQKVNPLKLGRMPALFVIDKAGRIRFANYGDSMSDIPTEQEILSLLDKLNKESEK